MQIAPLSAACEVGHGHKRIAQGYNRGIPGILQNLVMKENLP